MQAMPRTHEHPPMLIDLRGLHKYNFNLTTSEQTKLCAPPVTYGAPLWGARTPGWEPLI